MAPYLRSHVPAKKPTSINTRSKTKAISEPLHRVSKPKIGRNSQSQAERVHPPQEATEKDSTDPNLACNDDSIDEFTEIEDEIMIEGEGLDCVLDTYEVRYNSKGERWSLKTGSAAQLEFETDSSTHAALRLTRYYNTRKILDYTALEIQSPHIKKALQDVIKSYPSVNINSVRSIVIINEPKCLWHYHDELRAYAEDAIEPDVYRHVTFSLRYMFRALRKEILAYGNTMNNASNAPGLEFEHLWMAFRPGDLMFYMAAGTENVARLVEMNDVRENEKVTAWKLKLHRIHYDGTKFGHTSFEIKLEKFHGSKPLATLVCFPLQYHSEAQRVRTDLIARGRKYFSLAGIQHRMYHGRVELYNTSSPYSLSYSSLFSFPDEMAAETVSVEVHHAIVIDVAEFTLNGRQPRCILDDVAFSFDPKIKDDVEPGEEEYLICKSHIPGYSLVLKRWGGFDVALIQEKEYNLNAFSALVLPPEKKEMIRSLVNQRERSSTSFDDLIEGKGKGLIMLLHGPPGVGKTFTAESIAEYSHRPLYHVNCGDLGIHASNIEKELTKVLMLAARWGAVVLIDEADVFLAERRTYDLERNGLVSVLLRTLEYFEGVLFLATNKVEVIDPAFKSRVHFSIAYPELSFTSRRELWKVFAAKATAEHKPAWLNDEFLDRVAAFEINGRQIKNAARVANALATNENRNVDPEDILATLHALASFDTDFNNHTVKTADSSSDAVAGEKMCAQGRFDDKLRSSQRRSSCLAR